MNLEKYRTTAAKYLSQDGTPLEMLDRENQLIDLFIAMGASENEALHFVASVEEQMFR